MVSATQRKLIKYAEGQWFAVPLRKGGYALGLIARGSYKTKGGLGYFFGPRFLDVPGDEATRNKRPSEAVLITWFGDLGIITGRWVLIKSTRPFLRDDWPIPKFGRKDAIIPGKGFIVEYEENEHGEWKMSREVPVEAKEIINLPVDRFSGGGAVEIRLTEILIDS
jgi:hypothetical protein